jgi:hypothetical protein
MSFFACFCKLILEKLPVQMGIVSTTVYMWVLFAELHFLIRHLYLIGVWFSEDQRTNTIKRHACKRLDYIANVVNYSTLNIEHVSCLEDHLCIHQEINRHALHITITNSREVQLSIQPLVMPHCTFANVTQLPLCMYM